MLFNAKLATCQLLYGEKIVYLYTIGTTNEAGIADHSEAPVFTSGF